MNLGISKKVIFSFFLFINYTQQIKSADFYKVSEENNNRLNKLNWSQISNNKKLSKFSKKFSYYNENISQENQISNKKLESLPADVSRNNDELVIQSDKQSEKNNVIYAEGNVSVSYRGKFLRADSIIFDKLRRTISAKGNITLFFGEQIFKISQLEYNFKNGKGYLLEVKGSINSDKLFTDISRNFHYSDLQKLDDLLNLQKKEASNTPDKVSNWIFSTERINIDGNKWKSKKALFSNDILQFKQVKIKINSLEVYSMKDELRFKSSLNYLVLDENVSIHLAW